jgi:hypothetical protein
MRQQSQTEHLEKGRLCFAHAMRTGKAMEEGDQWGSEQVSFVGGRSHNFTVESECDSLPQ